MDTNKQKTELSNLTQQQAFDKVWQWFVVDKNPRSMVGTRCQYRGTSGAKCALGVLIPDALYDDILDEGMSYQSVVDRVGLPPWYKFWKQLQGCHDDTSREDDFTTGITDNLTNFATTYSLDIPKEEK